MRNISKRLRANGPDPEEARRQAHVRFGEVEKFKEEGREARGFAWLDSVSLDARLGLRMLAKHRWLTVVGGIAMAVAIALGASAFEVILTWYVVRMELAGPSIAVDRLVVANMVLSDEASARHEGLVRQRQDTLMSRLRAEPGVTDVTFSSAVPGLGPDRRIEFAPSTDARDEFRRLLSDGGSSLDVASFRIDVDLLRVYGVRLLAGRGFEATDVGAARAAIVNRTFVNDLLARRSLDERGLEPSRGALGTRFRYAAAGERGAPSAWYEIVGVVDDFPGLPLPRTPGAGGEPSVYHPMPSGAAHPAVLTIRFGDTAPGDVAERLRAVGAEIDPALQLRRVVPLSKFYDELRSVFRGLAWAVVLVTATVLLLSAASVHAMVSFTIAQRTREIGIRSALGIFTGAMRQLALGIAAGSLLSVGAFVAVGTGVWSAGGLLVTVAAVMAVVALLAAIGPARRILRIQTVEALRTEG